MPQPPAGTGDLGGQRIERAPLASRLLVMRSRQPGSDLNRSRSPDSVRSRSGTRADGRWADRGMLNQYAQANCRTYASWLERRCADCSTAALDWLLGAYGQQLGSLDDAIALLGPGTGISTRLGLLDARGPALAARGLAPREPRAANGQPRPLGSIAELEAWVNQGPLLMDGARWFFAGHWFVGIGYDAGGVYIARPAVGTPRYLSWSRLYGEVGFSGRVVGVAA